MTGKYDHTPQERDVRVHAVIDRHVTRKGALLPILHDLMAELGHIDDAIVPLVAERLNLSRADVHGVVTFYHDFRRKPPPSRIVGLCRAEACQSMGADTLAASCGDNVMVEAVYCLGLCSAAPSAMIDGRPFARLTPARLRELLA